MYLNYNLKELLKLLFQYFNYPIFSCLILVIIIYIYILYINKNSKRLNMMVVGINLTLIFIIICFYKNSLFNFNIFQQFNHNIYFYFLNSIIYLVLIGLLSCKNCLKLFNYIFYGMSLLFLCFALFMTVYLHNYHIIIIGNIYPSIVIGNYTLLLAYLFQFIKPVLTVIRHP